MHESNQAWQAENMTAPCHACGNWRFEADRTGRLLGLGRCKNLIYMAPVQMLVSINALDMVVETRIYDKAIVAKDISCFISSVVPEAESRAMASAMTVAIGIMRVVMRPWRK